MRFPAALLAAFVPILIWSLTGPSDTFTWFLEAVPAIAAFAILFGVWRVRGFRFTDLVYLLVFVHAIILVIGARYTYAKVPAFDWVRDRFHLQRNHYDRLGHLAQGFIPAIVVREILVRKSPLTRGKWLFFLTTCVCLAFSAFYELIEWWVSVGTGTAGDAFLGTQGDVWDTQWDMCCCLIGAITSQVALRREHDRQLAKLGA